MAFIYKDKIHIAYVSNFPETRLFQEWIRSYFGVFSEAGFPDDPMYPEYYDAGLEVRKNTGCNLTLQEEDSVIPILEVEHDGFNSGLQTHHQHVGSYSNHISSSPLKGYPRNKVRARIDISHK